MKCLLPTIFTNLLYIVRTFFIQCFQIPIVTAQTGSVIQVPQIAGAQPSCM